MKAIPITSSSNSSLKRIRALHQRSVREKEGLFLIEGVKLLNEALEKGVQIQDVVVSESFGQEGLARIDDRQAGFGGVAIVSDRLFKDLATTHSPCGVVAVGSQRTCTLEQCLSGADPLLAIGESIQDPGNAGTLIRAALAFGCSGMVFSKGSVDVYSAKVVRAAMGALFSLPVVPAVELKSAIALIKARGLRILALEPTASNSLDCADLSGPLAIVLGNEGHGLSADAHNLADELVTIPINEAAESLNVAVCGAIVLYQCSTKRKRQTKS